MLYELSPYTEALGHKFDPIIKMVKVNPGSSFEINSVSIPSFKVIGFLVPKKKTC